MSDTLDWRDERIPEIVMESFQYLLAIGDAAAAYRDAIESDMDERSELAALVAVHLARMESHDAISFHLPDGRTVTDIEFFEVLAHVPSDEPRDAHLMMSVPLAPLAARVREMSGRHRETRPLTDALVEDVTTAWHAFRHAVVQAIVGSKEARS